jgi:hypothetical protein
MGTIRDLRVEEENKILILVAQRKTPWFPMG